MSARTTSLKVPKPFCKVCHDAGKSEKEYTSHFVKSEPGPNGKVVCPTLLAQECRFCFAHGHTAGYCPAIAAKKKDEEKALKMASRKEAADKKPLPKPIETKSKNLFDLLGDSSDSDTDEKVSKKVTKKATKTTISAPVLAPAPQTKTQTQTVIKKEDFPSLPMKKVTKVAAPVMSGYASAAAKTQEDYETERYEQQLIANTMKKNQMPPMKTSYTANEESCAKYISDDSWEEEEAVVVRKPKVSASLLDWAALVDSDDEDW